MENEGECAKRERQPGFALLAIEPPHPSDDPHSGRPQRSGREQRPDDPGLAQELQRQVVRLGRDDARVPQQPVRQLERASAGSVQRLVLEYVPGLLPPLPAAARADRGQVLRAIRRRRARRSEVVEPAPRIGPEGGRGDHCHRADRQRA